jgi:hypothetical protein
MSDSEFSVVEFYSDGYHAYVERRLDAKNAVSLAKRCTDAATVASGFVVKVIITDGGDNTVFQWEHGKGVTFPPPEDRARESK